MRIHVIRRAGLACVLIAAACGGGSPAAPGGRPPISSSATNGSPPLAHAAPAAAVTLITGDRVWLWPRPDGTHQVSIDPGPGRSAVGFLKSQHLRRGREELTVIPTDAEALVAAGRLDRRLFDVTGLLRDGFGDAAQATLPLIVTYPAGAPARALAAARTTRALASVNGDATVVAKRDAAAFWATLTGDASAPKTAAALAGAGIAKLWLDGRARPLLDRSGPQIGAPTAWGLGLTGKGVTVALLDTGVQLDHPDFEGKIGAAQDFTATRADAGDDVGHGTHCAGVIAGSGAASHGRYKGVAPDVTLIEGKVCTPRGCPESAIIAGMEWAAPRARVVSMSLGGWPTDGTDPMSQALDRLTSQYGSLFVVAAGNMGERETVSSPAAANQALAVGSVTKDDTMSDFSSRGPRVGDHAVKPEIAAPGSDIVSARAKGTELGDHQPIDDYYAVLSGTSMAAPHVAGAAALLAQQHPDWRAAELKAALVSNSKRLAGALVPDDGAGRVDVARAVTQSVHAVAGTVSFGVAAWPQTGPALSRTVTYRNDGDRAVTLALAIAAADLDGKPAPAELFSVSPSALVVPAHGSADATVAFAQAAVPGAVGYYGGVLSAQDGVNVVAIAVSAYDEPESYDLTIRTSGRAPASTTIIQVHGRTNDIFEFLILSEGADVATVRLPKGVYDVFAIDHVRTAGSDSEATAAAAPGFDLSAARTIAWDFRAARPVRAIVDRPAEVVTQGIGVYVDDRDSTSGLDVSTASAAMKLYAIPTAAKLEAADRVFAFEHRAMLAEPTSATAPAGSASYAYHLVFYDRGQIPTQLTRRVYDRELAVVDSNYHAQGVATTGTAEDFIDIISPTNISYPVRNPSHRLELYTPDDHIHWWHLRGLEDRSAMLGSVRPELHHKRLTHVDWNRAPLGLAVGGFGLRRSSNQIFLTASVFSPSDEGHQHVVFAGGSDEQGATTLARGGQAMPSPANGAGWGLFDVPPDDGWYTLSTTAMRQVRYSPLAPQMSAVWTFRSQQPSGEEPVPLPLMAVRATGLVDDGDVAPAGVLYPLALTVEGQPDAPAPVVTELGLEVSYDDGGTWQPTPLVRFGNRALALLAHPPAAGFVSLRMNARDQAGNTAQQTTLHAYAIAPPGGASPDMPSP